VKSHSILIVEDDPDIRKILQYNLSREGFDTRFAATGEEGLDLARTLAPDAVILDLMLPGMDGLEVCKLLKYDARTRNIPVLMLTAKSSETDEIVGLEIGASDYLTKPFNVGVLLARVKNLLKSRTAAAAPASKARLREGEFEMDVEKMEFRVKDRPLFLTKIQFQILRCLMEHPGVVLSRERLVHAIWGQGAFVSDTAVNMHIKSIRRKLGKSGDRIVTVRGFGYRFGGSAG